MLKIICHDEPPAHPCGQGETGTDECMASGLATQRITEASRPVRVDVRESNPPSQGHNLPSSPDE
ncbi:Hypothetical protein CAP_3323 [Chondromyces apiculatus DSM 436]|uniref:Uncharacterized protein n=1 Tax=Chondromyces apiculatus DSM 436 TaxID=1192034 RepID=A0A017T9V5_9BACT|nr:Hypothetical protein CAP_3323 [Chondromyces apiculatus DSM 436]